MLTSDFDYFLPEELIAQHPPEKRGDSRMLVLDPAKGTRVILPFAAFPDFFHKGDTLVLNNTKVIKARLFAMKETGAKIEIMLLGPSAEGPQVWGCLLKPAKRVAIGTTLEILTPEGALSGEYITLVNKDISGNCLIRFHKEEVHALIARLGHMPLPPYIRRSADFAPDAKRYQTVYAAVPGAVAAPTAGLHFTDEVLAQLKEKEVGRTELTLHVGQGTFQPVTVENVADHPMHAEHFILDKASADNLNETRKTGRIAAVGTTSLRSLESAVLDDGSFAPVEMDTSIYIYPPYKIKSADMLLTNFHLPKSTLLMLVSAFAGYEFIMDTYKFAVKEKMRFFSYGDCMLILNHI